MDEWYPIQVKQKDKVGRPDVDSFEAVTSRKDRKKGFFVAFDYSSDALTEIDAFFRNETQTGDRHRPKSGLEPVPALLLTVREILEEQIAKKLA
jgi:hypothetical protein